MSSKKIWGNACWYLFHTLATKLKVEHENHVSNLLDNIIKICAVLPCPECAQHATQTLKRLNKRKVRSREDLIKVLFEFHNIVNRRVGHKEFSREDHDNLYMRAAFYSIYNNFYNVMIQNVKAERAMIYNMARRNVLLDFDKYIKENVHIFNI